MKKRPAKNLSSRVFENSLVCTNKGSLIFRDLCNNEKKSLNCERKLFLTLNTFFSLTRGKQ